MAKIKPMPELILPDGKPWHIEYSDSTAMHGATDVKGHNMMVPGGRSEQEMLVRFHEGVHVAISPDKRKVDKLLKKERPTMHKFSVLAAEDYRVSAFGKAHAKQTDLPHFEDRFIELMDGYLHPKDEKQEPDYYKFACMMAANFFQIPYQVNEMITDLTANPKTSDIGMTLDSFHDFLAYNVGNAGFNLRPRMKRFRQYALPVADALEAFRLAAEAQAKAKQKGVKQEGHNSPKAVDDKGLRWLPVNVERPELTVDAELAQCRDPKEYGIEIAYPEREFLDDKLFADQFDKPNASVLVDCSGSMHHNWNEVLAFAQRCPAGTMMLYSSSESGRAGKVVVVVENGMCIERLPAMPGENMCDVTALDLLARLSEPRYWVSDGRATKVNEYGKIVFNFTVGLEAATFAAQHRIMRVPTIAEAVNLITGND